MSLKAQVSIELIFVIVILLVILSLIMFSYISRTSEYQELEEDFDIKEHCISLSNMIYSVYKNGDGTTANFYTDKIVRSNLNVN